MYKVLLVDDEPIIVEGLSRSIPWERWNCRVVATANDGTEGKNLIEKERPDIVFMDICMPEMNGLQMIAALNSQFPDLEVSVLTGYRDFEYAKEAIRLGVTRFFAEAVEYGRVRRGDRVHVRQPESGAFFARVQKTGWDIGERIPQSGAWKIDQKVL